MKSIITTVVVGFVLAANSLHAESKRDKWEPFYKSVSKDIRSKETLKQIAAVEQFSEHDYEEAGEYLLKMLTRSSTDRAVAEAMSKVLSGFKDAKVRELVKNTINKRPDGSMYLLRAYLAQETSAEEKLKICTLILSKSRKSPCLTVAIDSLPEGKLDEKIIAFLVGKLPEKNYHSVRRAAAKALGNSKSATAIPALIKQVADHVTGDASQFSLLQLTGQSFGKNSTAWANWWKSAEKGYTYTDQTAKVEEFLKKKAKEAEDLAEEMDMAEFYGLPLEGKNILFLLDRSGSMAGDRIETLKNELTEMISQMGEDRSFGFVMFPLDSFPSRGIDQAREPYKKRAIRYAEKISVTGATPVSDAVKYAFEKVVEKQNVDTIYLLSDGSPSKPPAEVRKYIQSMNSELYVKIHCISIGGESQFLKDVAKDHSGNYIAVK